MAHEGRLEPVDDDVTEIIQPQTEGLFGDQVFPRESGVGDQPVISVEGYADPLVEVILEGVFLQAADALGMHVAGKTHLQRQPVVVHIMHQLLILHQPGAVPDAVGAAVVDGLMDAFGPEGLTGVQGGVDIVFQDQEKGLLVMLGGEILLGSRQIETHHPLVFELHRQVGQSQRYFR